MLVDNINQAWGGQLLQVSSSVQSSTAFGTVFLDIMVIVVIIGLLVSNVRWALSSFFFQG